MANRLAISKDDRLAIPQEPVINNGAVAVFELLNDPDSVPENYMDEATERVFSEGFYSDNPKADRLRLIDNMMTATSIGTDLATADMAHDQMEKTGFLATLREEWTDPVRIGNKIPITGALFGIYEMADIMKAASRLQDLDFDYSKPVIPRKSFGKEVGLMSGFELFEQQEVFFTREGDTKIIGDYIDRVTRDRTFFGKVAQGLSVLPTWMLEFAMTGGLANLGKKTTQDGMIKIMNNYAKTKIGKTALRAAGWTGGAITRASVGLSPRVVEKALERQVQVQVGLREAEGWATSFAKAWGDVTIEAASEEAGQAITGFGGAILRKTKLGAKIADGLKKAWISITGGSASEFNKLLAKGGYSNILGEIGEERLGTVLRAITDVEDFGAGPESTVMERLKAGLEQDIDNLGVEAVVLSVPFGAQSIVNRFAVEPPPEPSPAAPVAEPPAKAVITPAKPSEAITERASKRISHIFEDEPVAPTPTADKVIKPSKKQAAIDAKRFLAQVAQHEQLVKGEQGKITVEPIAFEIEKDQPEGLTPQWYEANRKVYKKTVLQKAGEAAKATWLGIEKIITPISTRLHNINPELFRRTRRHVFNVSTRTAEQTRRTQGFLDDVKKIPKKELRELDLAFKNSDGKKITEVLAKHGLSKQFKEVRKVLDEIYEKSIQVGLDIDYRRNYMPRMIKDAKGFLEAVRGIDDWPVIEEAIKRKEEERGRDLTDQERAAVANSMLRGYRTSALSISVPGATKKRTVPVVDARLNQFYMSFTDSLTSYIQTMNESIAAREFFGKESKSITKTRGQLSAAKTRQAKLKQRDNESKEAFQARKTKVEKKIAELETLLADLGASDLLDTIGAYVDQLIVDGKIKHSQERQVKDMLRSLFDPSGMGSLLGKAKSLTYIVHLGSPLNALTQIEDLAISFYRSPLGALPEAVRAFINTSEITPEDIGVTTIAEELSGADIKRALTMILRITGFAKIDKIGKQTFINTVIRKMRSQARKPSKSFNQRLKRVFGDEFQQVIKDLKSGKITDNIKYLAFNQLLDAQPLALTELPEAYNRSGNLRILYTLKTFMIRQFDFIRNEALADMRHKDTFMRGFGRLVWLTFALALFGAGVDAVKDFIRGREFDLDDAVVDNILRRFFFSKYQITTARRDGILRSYLEGFLPPTALLDRMVHDLIVVWEDPSKAVQSLRNLPLVGELLYNWWFVEKKKKGKPPKFRTSE